MLVLIVDDDQHTADLYTEAIHEVRPGASVLWAATAEVARTLIKTDSPNVIILDLNLPYGSGLTVIDFMSKQDHSITYVFINSDIDSQTVDHSIKHLITPNTLIEVLPTKMRSKDEVLEVFSTDPT